MQEYILETLVNVNFKDENNENHWTGNLAELYLCTPLYPVYTNILNNMHKVYIITL